jgi:hypothetical protein
VPGKYKLKRAGSPKGRTDLKTCMWPEQSQQWHREDKKLAESQKRAATTRTKNFGRGPMARDTLQAMLNNTIISLRRGRNGIVTNGIISIKSSINENSNTSEDMRLIKPASIKTPNIERITRIVLHM